ncbi:MAG: hypothetical protein M5R36_16675 [Deltaproteobacteria bacterium]|nr:hypothetical protein [Deltaproteobacteria bacterium]
MRWIRGWFRVLVTVAFAVTGMVACFSGEGDDDDDDDNDDTASEDDYADDDDVFSDDDVSDDDLDEDDIDDGNDQLDDDTCALGIEFAYDCGWVLTSDTGNLTESEGVAECEASDTLAVCLASCGLTSSTCEDVDACVVENCSSKRT